MNVPSSLWFGIVALVVAVPIQPLVAPVAAAERLSMRVSASVAFAPANLLVKTMVEANKDNRSLEVSAESDDFYRSSELSLDGERAPRTTIVRLPALPGGHYVVRAVLRGAGGLQIATSEINLNIVSGDSSSH